MTDPMAQPAPAELLALAAKTREDIDLDDLQGVLADAQTQGRPWTEVMTQTVRMLARGEDVHDLRAALHDPLGLRRHRR